MHVFQIDALQIGVADLICAERAHKLSVTHDPNSRATLFRSEEIVRGHQNRASLCAQLFQ